VYCCTGGPHHLAINSNVCFTAEDWTVFDTVITLVHSSLMAIWPFSNVTARLFFASITGHPETTHAGYALPSVVVRFDGYSLLWSSGKLCENQMRRRLYYDNVQLLLLLHNTCAMDPVFFRSPSRTWPTVIILFQTFTEFPWCFPYCLCHSFNFPS